MLSNSARMFFEKFVRAAREQWQSQRLNELHALTFAVVLAHMADYYFLSYPPRHDNLLGSKDVKSFREKIAAASWPYAVIRDIADAQKHMSLDRKSANIKSSSQVHVGKRFLDSDIIQFFPDHEDPLEIVITLNDGKKLSFEDVVSAVFAEWESRLA